MRTLFVDTHAAMLNLGIVEEDKLISETKLLSDREHSSRTLFNIDRMLIENTLAPKDIDTIIVVNGPGSYTGLRIGVTVAKTYAYTLNKKVIPASSLKSAAISINDFDYAVIRIDAKRDSYFAAIYDKEYNEILCEQYITKEDLDLEIAKLKGNVVTLTDYDDYDILKVVNYYKSKDGVNPHSLIPNYLKETHIEKK